MPSIEKAIPQRRASDAPEVRARQTAIEARMDAIEVELAKNTALTKSVVDVFQHLESGLKVMGWLGAAAKWVVTISAFCGLVWAVWTGKPLDK